MKKTKKKTKKTGAKRPKLTNRTIKGRRNFHAFVDELFDAGPIPSIVIDLEHYKETMKTLSELRRETTAHANERAASAIEAHAAEHRYAVATAALEQANGQIVALKAQPAKIDRWHQEEIAKGRSPDACAVAAPAGVRA